MRLCRKLNCTLAELARRMTLDELPLWIADFQLDPWGEERADYSRAIIAAAFCGGEPEKYLVKYDHIPLPESVQQEVAAIQFDAAMRRLAKTEAHGE
jgi:hypothetical protein